MAELFYYDFWDINERRYTIEVFKDNYDSSDMYQVTWGDATPSNLDHVGGGKDNWDGTYITGRELVFKWYIPREDISLFDSLLESEYQDWHVTLSEYNSNSKLFNGYLKPENIYKRYETNPPYIEIELQAIDGLAELKEVDFPSVPEQQPEYENKISALQALQFALVPLNLELPFEIQLNTYEVHHMTSVQCALEKLFINITRFYTEDEDKSEITPMKCYDVIEMILKPFNCKLSQNGDYYVIKNHLELQSYTYKYNWDLTVLQGRTQSTAPIDIEQHLYYPYVEQQKIHPLGKIDITVQNEEQGIEEITYEDDWLDLWSFDTDWTTQTVKENNVLELFTSVNGCEPWMRLQSPITVIPNPDANGTEYIRISFDYRLTQFDKNKAGNDKLSLKIRISRNGTWTEYVKAVGYPTFGWQRFDSQFSSVFWISPSASTTINVEIFLDSLAGGNHFGSLTFQLANMELSQWCPTNTAGFNLLRRGSNKTYTQVNIYTSSASGARSYESLELDLLLFDGVTTTEEAALVLFDAGTSYVTANWNIYGNTGGEGIVATCTRNILSNRSRYKNYLRCTIIDRNYGIHFENTVIIHQRYYAFASYSRDLRSGEINAELIELINTTLEGFDDLEDTTTLKAAEIPIANAEEIDYWGDTAYQVDHGFIVGDVIRAEEDAFGVVSYYLAKGDTIANAQVLGMVSEVFSDDVFAYKADGYLDAETLADLGYAVKEGQYYYLSAVDAGKLVLTSTLETYGIETVVAVGTDRGLKIATISQTNSQIVTDLSVTGLGTETYPITLVNDEDTPGPNKVYGTDPIGEKGFISHIHNGLPGLQGGLPPYLDSSGPSSNEESSSNDEWSDGEWIDGEYYHHTEWEIYNHVYEAPNDGKYYARKDNEWYEIISEYESITDFSITGNGSNSSPITLVNDEDAPGILHYYGTDEDGIKGFYPLNILWDIDSGGNLIYLVSGDSDWNALPVVASVFDKDYEWCIDKDAAEVFTLDMYAAYSYTITKIIAYTDDGTLSNLSVSIGSITVSGLDDIDLTTSIQSWTATANNVVAEGDLISLDTSGSSTGAPTIIHIKMVYTK